MDFAKITELSKKYEPQMTRFPPRDMIANPAARKKPSSSASNGKWKPWALTATVLHTFPKLIPIRLISVDLPVGRTSV